MRKVDSSIPTLLGHLVTEARAGMVRAGGCPLDAFTWRQAIGERIASHSSPEHLRDGVLTLRVSSSVWAQELSLLSQTIIERLAPLGFRVHTVRCKVGTLEAPAARRRALPPAPPTPPVELPPELKAELARIDDADLRVNIEAAARAQLQLRKDRVSRMQSEHTAKPRAQRPTPAKAERANQRRPSSNYAHSTSVPTEGEPRSGRRLPTRNVKD